MRMVCYSLLQLGVYVSWFIFQKTMLTIAGTPRIPVLPYLIEIPVRLGRWGLQDVLFFVLKDGRMQG